MAGTAHKLWVAATTRSDTLTATLVFFRPRQLVSPASFQRRPSKPPDHHLHPNTTTNYGTFLCNWNMMMRTSNPEAASLSTPQGEGWHILYAGQRNLGKMNHRGTLSQGAPANKTKFPAAGASKTEPQGYTLTGICATPRLGV